MVLLSISFSSEIQFINKHFDKTQMARCFKSVHKPKGIESALLATVARARCSRWVGGVGAGSSASLSARGSPPDADRPSRNTSSE